MHGLDNSILYAVNKLTLYWTAPAGSGEKDYSRQGTGFFIVKDGNIYLITNKHVVKPIISKSGEKYKLKAFTVDIRKYDYNTNTVKVEEIQFQKWSFSLPDDPHDDICCIYLPYCSAEHTIPHYIKFEVLANHEDFFNTIKVCDEVALIGFPIVYDHWNNLPILRRGCLSSDPRMNYSYNEEYNGHQIALELYSTGGASGSPIFALQKGFPLSGALTASEGFFRPVKLIGINAGCITSAEDTHLQISYAYKSSEIIKVIEKAEKDILYKSNKSS